MCCKMIVINVIRIKMDYIWDAVNDSLMKSCCQCHLCVIMMGINNIFSDINEKILFDASMTA